MESILFVLISTLMLTGHSLAASHTFKTQQTFNSTTLLVFSVSPAFLVSIFWSFFLSYSVSWLELGLIALKNSLYAVVLFLRLESFKILGAYSGAVLLIMQPIAIAILSWLLLGESLNYLEGTFAAFTLSGIWMASTSGTQSSHPLVLIVRYVTVPAILMAFIALIERYILLGAVSAIEFFVIDKLIMLPTFLVMYVFCIRLGFIDARIDFCGTSSSRLSLMLLVLGGLWGTSTLFYALALEREKTMWVTMIRSLSVSAR
jgi:hypothetical protein